MNLTIVDDRWALLTVARRISRLQEIRGAQTRFQLRVQASRHGWL
jgi:hypothetical protein